MEGSKSKASNQLESSISVKLSVLSRGDFELDLPLNSDLKDLIRLTETTLGIDNQRFSLIFQNTEISNHTINVIDYGLYEGCVINIIAKVSSGQSSKQNRDETKVDTQFFESIESIKLKEPEKYQMTVYDYMSSYAEHIIIGHDRETDQITFSIANSGGNHIDFLGTGFNEQDNTMREISTQRESCNWRLIPITDHRSLSSEEEIEKLNDINSLDIIINHESLSSDLKLSSEFSENLVSPIIPKPDKDRCSHCKKKLRLTNQFTCRCGLTLCSLHRYSDRHECNYDFLGENCRSLLKQNPRVHSSKIDFI